MKTGPASTRNFVAFTTALTSKLYGSLRFDRPMFLLAHDTHVRAVREYFEERPDRLLELDFASLGWEPLCTFLARPVPSVPFPNPHSSAQVSEWRARTVRARSALTELLGDGATIALIGDAKVPGLSAVDGITVIRFPSHDGQSAGRAASREHAVAEAERLMSRKPEDRCVRDPEAGILVAESLQEARAVARRMEHESHENR